MKKSDKQITDMLKIEFDKSAENAEIPLRLQKESIIKMIENSENNQTDFSCETGTSKVRSNNIIVLRKLTAIAAMLAIVVISALVMKTGDGVKVIRTDSFYEGYKSADPVKNAQSYEEVEKVISEILGEKADESTKKATSPDKTPNDVTSVQTTKKDVRSIIEGYSEFVANAKPEEGSEPGVVSDIVANEPDGVAKYGDFKADIVKNDGEFLYIASTGVNSVTGDTIEQIKILKTGKDGTMNAVSTIVLSEGTNKNNFDECLEIYLKNDRLIVLMSRHEYDFTDNAVNDYVSTVAVCYDISDPYFPSKIREHIQDGNYISSSLYENRLCLVTAKNIPPESGKTSGDIIPSYSINGTAVKPKAEDIFIAINDPEASYLFVTVTDVSTDNVGCLAVLGCGNEVYCSSSALAVSRNFVSVEADKNGEYENLTEIYRFNIGDASIDFSGSYIVQGSLVGGVSVDETDGSMKAVTSTKKANNIYVLSKEMEFVSGLKDIFSGEKVSGVKFIGSNCYVFVDGEEEKTMIVDFSDPSNPGVAGTISEKIFSDDLYAVSDNLLLGITETENKAVTLTLFDVSNPNEPKISASHTMDKNCYSLSSGDSRSVMLVSEKRIIGIPIVKKNTGEGTESSAYALFDTSGGEIVSLGTYNHDASYIGDAAVRGTCIEDILYTVSGEKVVAFRINKTEASDNSKEFPLS